MLNALASELTQLAQDVAATRGPGATSQTDSGTDEDDTGANTGDFRPLDALVDPWLWEQDTAIAKHGPGLAAFALALPAIPRQDADLTWLDRLTDDDEPGLETDTADTLDSDPNVEVQEATEEGPEHSGDPEHVKRGRRRWCQRAVDLISELPTPSRLLVVRLLLAFWSSGNWPTHDMAPMRLLEQALRALPSLGMSSEAETRVGSLAAVGFTMLRDRVRHDSQNEGSLLYRRLAADLGFVTLAAEPSMVDEYVRFQRTAAGFPLLPDHVHETVQALTAEDALADAVRVLESEGVSATRPAPRVLHLTGTFTNPEHAALRAVALLEDADPVGAWAVTEADQWAFIGWRRPDLVRITATPAGPRWRHQVLSGLIGPAALYSQRLTTTALRNEKRHGPQNKPFAEAQSLLQALGVEGPAPPELRHEP
jgi:hypothetical protein